MVAKLGETRWLQDASIGHLGHLKVGYVLNYIPIVRKDFGNYIRPFKFRYKLSVCTDRGVHIRNHHKVTYLVNVWFLMAFVKI